MKRWLTALFVCALLTGLAGCGGGEHDRNKNKDLDKPQSGEKDR